MQFRFRVALSVVDALFFLNDENEEIFILC
jgi:hypothetical protein